MSKGFVCGLMIGMILQLVIHYIGWYIDTKKKVNIEVNEAMIIAVEEVYKTDKTLPRDKIIKFLKDKRKELDK